MERIIPTGQPDPAPFWAEVLYPKSFHLLTAPRKKGKSMILHTMTGRLSQGLEWGGIAPIKPLVVLYVACEGPGWLIAKRIAPYHNSNLNVFYRDWAKYHGDLTTIELKKAMQSMEKRPDWIIVDPLSLAFLTMRENEADSVRRTLAPWAGFAEDQDVMLTFAHHDRKSPIDPKMKVDPSESARGSSVLGAIVHTQWNIVEHFHGGRVFQVTFSRFGTGPLKEPKFRTAYDESMQELKVQDQKGNWHIYQCASSKNVENALAPSTPR